MLLFSIKYIIDITYVLTQSPILHNRPQVSSIQHYMLVVGWGDYILMWLTLLGQVGYPGYVLNELHKFKKESPTIQAHFVSPNMPLMKACLAREASHQCSKEIHF